MEQEIKDQITKSSELIKESETLAGQIEQAIEAIISSIKKGKKVVIFGNGGSAADAQHIAGELVGRFLKERKSYPAIALTTDSSIITALANDYSFDRVFERQCEGLVEPGDIAIGLSTSGNSKNVLKGLEMAKTKGAITIALLGCGGGTIKDIVDIAIIVPSDHTPEIQEVHHVIYHIICKQVELNLSE